MADYKTFQMKMYGDEDEKLTRLAKTANTDKTTFTKRRIFSDEGIIILDNAHLISRSLIEISDQLKGAKRDDKLSDVLIDKVYSKLCDVTRAFVTTDTPHLHLMINSVNFRTSKMFSQSISGLNRFKLHCNNEFAKNGLDPIGKPTEMMMDTVVHEMSEGFDCLELFDEIMADKASSLSDLYSEPVTEYKPLYTPEYTRGDSIVCAPTQTRTYFNPDSPKPWCRIIINPDESWGIPTRPFDDFDNHLIRFMSLTGCDRICLLISSLREI